MRRRRGPLFLKRGSYRKRRLRDGARMLPVLGLVVFFMPVLWAQSGGAQEGTAGDGLYLFAVWFGLVLVAALMAPGLAADGGDGDAPDDGAGEG